MKARIAALLAMALVVWACGTDSGVVAGDVQATPDQAGTDLATDMATEATVLPDLTIEDTAEAVDWTTPDVPSEGTTADFGPEPGEAGYPCINGGDCLSGYCVQTMDGKQCSVTCVDECPFGWQCVQDTASLPDMVFVCAPGFVSLCRPCLVNTDCMVGGLDGGQRCVDLGSDGAFCGAPCETDDDCPDGHICTDGTDSSGADALQCTKAEGLCQCSQMFVDQGAKTDCFVENEWGLCSGSRGCESGGLTECSASVPGAEVCNGADDDCNGQADDGIEETSCPLTNEFGTCPGTSMCIGGETECQGQKAQPELCDGVDNDCDGSVDEGFADTDGDGKADCLTDDKDGDGILNGVDNCSGIFNPNQNDNDLDTVGDKCDPDDDNDKVPDEEDCAPKDDEAYPGNDEVCDGKDNNCDYVVDEGFDDADMDGWKDCVDEDDDNDSYKDALDCAPFDSLSHPGALEVCDGKDNDCDFDVDEGFADQDGDGKADCADDDADDDGVENAADNCPAVANPQQEDLDGDGLGDACDPDADGDAIPDGADNCKGLKNTLQNDIDNDGLGDACDQDKDGDGVENDADNCPLVANALQTDSDQDGQGDACEDDKDGDGVADGQDCAPLNPAVFPGAQELCDGIDNDCDLAQDEGFPDFDADGVKNCVDSDDDDDGDADDSDCQPLNPAINHTAAEICDGKDNNCNGQVDEGLGKLKCGKGACSHEVAICANGATQICDPYEGAGQELCDGVDNDCDGLVDEDQGKTTCGLGMCQRTIDNCVNGQPQECDPQEGASAEICDGLDNDCDGPVDEDQPTLACGEGACFHTVESCVGGVGKTCDPMAGAGPEVCDGLDNDCNGEADDGLGTVTCGKGECLHEQDYCVGGKVAPCDPFLGVSPEVCDGLDNDCDGLIDEDLGVTTCGKGECEHMVVNCVDAVPQQCDPKEGAQDETCDGLDNDCDGQVDENLGLSTCGVGQCLHTVPKCLDGEVQECDPEEGKTDEVCDGADNDCDGVTDPDDTTGCLPFLLDADDDDYGVDGKQRCLCAMDPPYTALLGGDCDDGDPAVNPAQDESCDTLVDDNCNDQVNEGCVFDNCKAVLSAIPDAPSGMYSINPDGVGVGFPAWCDMETDGGGWTLVMKQKSGSGYGSPLSVSVWSGWGQPNVVMNADDATLEDANMVNLAYSELTAVQIRMTASQTWLTEAAGAWMRTINSTPYSALSNANANKTGNEGSANNTPWPAASFTDHTWTKTTTGNDLCWRAGPWFNRTSFEYTQGGIKWGWFFNNECGQSTTDTGEGLGCCGNSGWYRESPWTLYLWAR